ncbi:MAG: restriction endonuclease subunit S [Lachnospiraceae bacterium]|nr:restriction endonuclease subunit S [Lachnospiraceae bacterium]
MKYKLGDICEIVSGSTPKTSVEEYWDGDIKWITPAELTDDSYIIDDTARKLTELGVKKTGLTPFPAGTVILSSRAPIGKVAIAGCEMYCNQGFKNLICSDKINNKYLYWFLKGNTVFLNSLGRGATFKEISKGIVGNIEINVPDVADQEKAVVNLEKLSEIIKLRKSELEGFDNLIKARFVEFFGDPKINEKNWKTGVVSDFYEVKGGKRIPKGMGYADGITIHPYLRATDMKNETILDDDIHYISDEVFEKIKRYTVKGGDIYLTNVGVNLGMAGVIPDKYDGANLTENAVKLVPKSEIVLDGLFLAHYINSPGIQDYINERKMSVGVPKLAIFRIETMPLILPPMDLQIQFINFCKQVDKSKVAVEKALDETQTLFDSLMQEYFG